MKTDGIQGGRLPLPRKKRRYLFPVWAVILCMVPGLLHYAVIRVYPSFMTGVYSFTDISGVPGSSWSFVGWDNYKEFFVLQNARDLKGVLVRTGVYALTTTIIQNSIALLLAIVVNNKYLKGRNFARSVFFLPVILGTAVVSIMWKLIFSAPGGPVYQFMLNVLHISNPPVILSSTKYAFTAIIGAQIWQHMGYSMVIFLASLQSVDETLYEAARIDGAGDWDLFWHVTVPNIWAGITVNTLLSIVGALQSYDLLLTITGGDFETATLGMLAFSSAFGNAGSNASSGAMRQGYAAAVSMVLFVIVLVATVISRLAMRKMEAEQ